MSDTDFDPDVVWHITYDGWPIQRQVDKDGQTNPIGFNSKHLAENVAYELRQELILEYESDTEHSSASAISIANKRIKLVRQDL